MKFFISGQIKDIPAVRETMQHVVDAGHTITHDWTSSDIMLGGDNKFNDLAETGRRAQADIQGVLDCDVYVLCSDNETPGKGMYVELGAALGRAQSGDRIKLYVIGKLNHSSIFYLHPAVRQVESIQDVLREAI
jgi:hypothetical protein